MGLLVLSLCKGLFGESSVEENQGKHKYLYGKQEIPVVFYVKENDKSNRYIARKGHLLKKPDARATVLICHGFMCDKYDVRFLRFLFDNYNTFIFDMRAHGEVIEGQCCTFGRDEAYDVMGAAQFIKSQPDLKDKPLIVYGFSMGAASSILAQSMEPTLFTAAIWDCPFESSENLIARGLDRLRLNIWGYEFELPGKSLLQKYAYNDYVQSILKVVLKTVAKMDATQVVTCIVPIHPQEAIKKVTIPCLIIGCKNDDKAPQEAVQAVYNNAQGFKRLWITNGRRHFDSFFYNPEKYSYKINRFIEKLLDKQLPEKAQEKIEIEIDETGDEKARDFL